jgi:hypothetical protein
VVEDQEELDVDLVLAAVVEDQVQLVPWKLEAALNQELVVVNLLALSR